MNRPDPELLYEQERNKDYIISLGRKRTYAIKGVDERALAAEWGPLLGRVSMASSADDDSEFYVGHRGVVLADQVRVVSWASPAAAVLFDGGNRWRGQEVRVKRRFHSRGHQVTGYVDTWFKRDGRPPFPALESQPSRPRPRPGSPDRGRSEKTLAEVVSTPNNLGEIERRRRLQEAMRQGRYNAQLTTERQSATRREPDNEQFLTEHPQMAQALAITHTDPVPVSAEEALVAVLRAPRREALRSILPTLQPSQYEAVTSDPLADQLFIGHPGTGKTVIATHRAAWLTNPDREQALDYVLAVGPTDGWAAHVSQVIADLGEQDHVTVLSLPGLFHGFLESEWVPPRERDNYMDTDMALGDAILSITPQTSQLTFDQAYQRLRNYVPVGTPNAELMTWCKALPASLGEALRRTELWPALALLKIRIDRFTKFHHIVVDEAQDLRPLEWMVLRALNGGQWSIIGDLNQRRTAFTPSSWDHITELLDISDPKKTELEQGFRTTQQITDFAARLLDRRTRARTSAALGAGEAPHILDARALNRPVESTALSEVKRLAKRNPQWRIAVITTNVKRMGSAATQASWRRAGAKNRVGSYEWGPGGQTALFHLLHPYQARGLEFDAVIVVEPADFPTLLGQFGGAGTHGPLYTSLTRANLHLSIVHWKPLPRALTTR